MQYPSIWAPAPCYLYGLRGLRRDAGEGCHLAEINAAFARCHSGPGERLMPHFDRGFPLAEPPDRDLRSRNRYRSRQVGARDPMGKLPIAEDVRQRGVLARCVRAHYASEEDAWLADTRTETRCPTPAGLLEERRMSVLVSRLSPWTLKQHCVG